MFGKDTMQLVWSAVNLMYRYFRSVSSKSGRYNGFWTAHVI